MTWRVLMVQANLDVDNGHWAKSKSFQNLDPSEKGSVSYFLGLAQAHAVCTKILGYSHLIHLDALMGVQKKKLKGKRSDLIGLTAASTVTPTLLSKVATVEAKGRTNGAPQHLRDAAKKQAGKIASLNATHVVESVASISYFEDDDRWASYLVDPHWSGNHMDAAIEDALRHYYAGIIDAGRESVTWTQRDEIARFEIPDVGIAMSMPESLVHAYDRSVEGADTGTTPLTAECTRLILETNTSDDFITPSFVEGRLPKTRKSAQLREPGSGRWEVYRTKDGRFRFRLFAGNGVQLLISEPYASRESALGGIRSVRAMFSAETAASAIESPWIDE